MSVLRCTLNSLLWGSICQNVMHWIGPPYDSTLLENTALLIETGWVPTIKTVVANQVTFYQVRVDDITDGGSGQTFTKTFSITGTGGSDDAVAPNLAFVLQLQSGLAGRKNHGRIFVPGLRPANLYRGLISPDATTAWTTPLANINSQWVQGGSDDFTLGIMTRGGPTDAIRPVTHVQLRSTPGSARTRMVGVGS